MKKTCLAILSMIIGAMVLATSAEAANFTLSPATGNYDNGSQFDVIVGITSGTSKVFAADIWATFDASKLEMLNVVRAYDDEDLTAEQSALKYIQVSKDENSININKSIVSTETTPTQEENDLEKAKIEEEAKELEASFQEISDLKMPYIEEARNFEKSLKNGSVIMINRDNSQEHEVYNIASLDKFIDSFNNGKEGYVRVIKGGIEKDGTFLVNKLEEYETDGKVIKDLVYDTYADKNKFVQGKPRYCPKMAKVSTDDAIRYAILESKDTPDNMGGTVISFYKSSIKN